MEYRPRLDGLRCVAIMMVLLGHFYYFLGRTNSGIYGVNLFFVLSGFLITSILLSDRSASFFVGYKKFIARRALRIFPVYYLIIIFYIVVRADAIQQDWPYLLTYTYNFWVSNTHGWVHYMYAPYWSLSVEEQFYLFFPWVVLLLNRHPKVQLSVFFGFIVLAFFDRIFHITHVHHYVNLVTNMWALTIGATGAWFVKHSTLNHRFFNSLLAEVIIFIAFAFLFWQGENMIGFIFYPLINIYFVIKASEFSFKIGAVNRFLASKPAVFIGRISYGIYLYHIVVKHYFETYIFQPLWDQIQFSKMGFFSKLQYNAALIKFPFLVCLTILVALLSFRFIETPFLRLKNKYFKS